jgi:hypothetical protein
LSAHVGRLVSHCPACLELPSVAHTGLAFAARLLLHEAQTPEDEDLAATAEWVALEHRPGPGGGACLGCGDPWVIGMDDVIPCETWASVRAEVNRVVCERVLAVVRRYSGTGEERAA